MTTACNHAMNLVKLRCNCTHPANQSDPEPKRRACGCLRTCDKVKALLDKFPGPTPPASYPPAHAPAPVPVPATAAAVAPCCFPMKANLDTVSKGVGSVYRKMTDVIPKCCDDIYNTIKPAAQSLAQKCSQSAHNYNNSRKNSEPNAVLTEIGQLLQLSITASALILYYMIYCYMQLVYFTLRSALYFHNADGPMKVTITVVLVSTLIVGINLFLRIERILGIIPY